MAHAAAQVMGPSRAERAVGGTEERLAELREHSGAPQLGGLRGVVHAAQAALLSGAHRMNSNDGERCPLPLPAAAAAGTSPRQA